MQSIKSLSVSPAARDWLNSSLHPRVLHVFDLACNLIDERGNVLSIVTQSIGDGPINLVVEDDFHFSTHLNVDSPISKYENEIRLGDVTIQTGSARVWGPRPDWEELHANKERIFTQLLSINHLHAQLDSHAAGTIESTLSDYLDSISTSLVSAIASADLARAKLFAGQLAGLGEGLTPAGDDFILGAMLATWIIHRPDVAMSLLREVANAAAPITTSISGAWLRSASKGETGILWHNFLAAMNTANELAIQRCAKNILDIGHYSGAYALEGFISMFLCWSESYPIAAESSQCPS